MWKVSSTIEFDWILSLSKDLDIIIEQTGNDGSSSDIIFGFDM